MRDSSMMAPHQMLTYIREQPEALASTLDHNRTATLDLSAFIRGSGFQRLVITGVGSSYTAARIAEPLMTLASSVRSQVLPATEVVSYGTRLFGPRTAVVFVSRSGERGFVLDALEEAKRLGAYCIAATAADSNLLAKSCHRTLLTREGNESAFPKTKSVAAAAGLLMQLAHALGSENDPTVITGRESLKRMPEILQAAIRESEQQVPAMVEWSCGYRRVLLAGAGSNYGAALEGAIKLQETSCMPTQTDDLGNLFHGALGALNNEWLVAQLVTQNDAHVAGKLDDLLAKFHVGQLWITDGFAQPSVQGTRTIALSHSVDWPYAGLAFLPPLQLIAYHGAVRRGLNPDRPAFAAVMFEAMLAPGRAEPDWDLA